MKISELQNSVDEWIKTYGVRYFNELTNTVILMEEVGELSKLIARVYGEQSFKYPMSKEEQFSKMEDEMADILWVITCLANQIGIDLEKAIIKNIEKKTNRDKYRHQQNEKL